MKNFRVEDMPVKIAHAKDSKSAKSEAQPQQQAAPTSTEPPDGTSAEVKAWVGDDKERAQAALDKEQANERPRSGLSEDLQKILDEPADEDDK
jgi:hypothetical protein